MQIFQRFCLGLQLDLKVFLFFILFFNLSRAIFLAIYWDKIPASGLAELGECLWLGFRLSLKTAGMAALTNFALITLPHTVLVKYPAQIMRKLLCGLYIFIFTFLYFVKIEYYKLYNATFNNILLNGFQHDLKEVGATAVTQYGAIPKFILVLVLSYVLYKALTYLLCWKIKEVTVKNQQDLLKKIVMLVIGLPILFIFVRFGGGYNYGTGIHWENACRLKTHILNEAVLDDGQALYRVYSTYRRMKKSLQTAMDSEKVRKSIVLLEGNLQTSGIDEAFKRKVVAERLKEQPDTIVFILGENYASWPFYEQYADLGIVEGGKKLINSEKAIYSLNFLSQGGETVAATNALITGLDNLNLAANYQPVSYQEKYKTGIAAIMKNLGYTTYFWYGGFNSWQDIERFSSAQNFDYFRSADDYPYAEGNAWGAADEYLYTAVKKHIEENPQEKAFHFILTMSNHPPFFLDVEAKGFNKAAVADKLPEEIPSDAETLQQLGHIWYADKMMYEFIKWTEMTIPNSLFVVVGDHAQRFSFAKDVSLEELTAVPCIFYGKNIEKDWLQDNFIGSQMQLTATMAELAGRTGFEYSSVLPSVFSSNKYAYNDWLYIDDNEKVFRRIDNYITSELKNELTAERTITAWRVVKGDRF